MKFNNNYTTQKYIMLKLIYFEWWNNINLIDIKVIWPKKSTMINVHYNYITSSFHSATMYQGNNIRRTITYHDNKFKYQKTVNGHAIQTKTINIDNINYMKAIKILLNEL